MPRHLAGDVSLDSVFPATLALLGGDHALPSVKGEPSPKKEDQDSAVKLELEDEEGEQEEEVKVKAKVISYKEDSSEDDDQDDDEDYYEGGEDDDDEEEFDGKEESKDVETCDRCSKTYQKRAHFKKHLENCNPEQIERLLPRPTVKQRQKLKTEQEDGRSQKKSIEKRKKTLSQIQESCNACQRSFKHRSFLIHHLKSCNPEQIPELMQQKMSHKVAKRMKAILADENPLNCAYCPRKFTFKKSLEKHELLHKSDPDSPSLDEKKIRKYNGNTNRIPMGNYQCDKCSSSFKLYAALERHMEAHMLAATAKPEDSQDEKTDQGLTLKTNLIRYEKETFYPELCLYPGTAP